MWHKQVATYYHEKKKKKKGKRDRTEVLLLQRLTNENWENLRKFGQKGCFPTRDATDTQCNIVNYHIFVQHSANSKDETTHCVSCWKMQSCRPFYTFRAETLFVYSNYGSSCLKFHLKITLLLPASTCRCSMALHNRAG